MHEILTEDTNTFSYSKSTLIPPDVTYILQLTKWNKEFARHFFSRYLFTQDTQTRIPINWTFGFKVL